MISFYCPTFADKRTQKCWEKTLKRLLSINFLLLPQPLYTEILKDKTLKGLLSINFLLLSLPLYTEVLKDKTLKKLFSNRNSDRFCPFHRIMSTLVHYYDQLDI